MFTVRAAISWCSYCRARFDPCLTPRGGISDLLVIDVANLDTVPADKPDLGCLSSSKKWNQSRVERKEDSMYIGGGVLTLIVIILLLIWLF